jgi:hypothetical protein
MTFHVGPVVLDRFEESAERWTETRHVPGLLSGG